MSRRGEEVASVGTPLPRRRVRPQGPAVPRKRWAADAGVKKAALEIAALHHGAAGTRQVDCQRREAAWRRGWIGSPREQSLARGLPVPAFRRGPRPLAAGGPVGPAGSARPRAAGEWDVERGRPSDMLPRRKILGIQGVSRSRRAASDTACGQSMPPWPTGPVGRTPEARRAGWQAVRTDLDRVRRASGARVESRGEPTPDGGARGRVPPSRAPRGRADRRCTPGPQLGFRNSCFGSMAARALQRPPVGLPIEWLHGRAHELAWGCRNQERWR